MHLHICEGLDNMLLNYDLLHPMIIGIFYILWVVLDGLEVVFEGLWVVVLGEVFVALKF